MARTVQEIKKQMTDAFMANPDIQEKYKLTKEDTFENSFSPVSLENILFFIIAAAHHVVERIFELFKKDIEEKIEESIVATIPWYHHMALTYQHGHSIELDEKTWQYKYKQISPHDQVIKYVAVKDIGGALRILVSGEKKGKPIPLSNEVLIGFKAYMNTIKIAGTILSIYSLPADQLILHMVVEVDPMIFSSQGNRLLDGKSAVSDAIKEYLSHILYGGIFNKNKLVDAIQKVEGVKDITLGECYVQTTQGNKLINTNNYAAQSGVFVAEQLNETIQYVLSI